MKTPPTQDAGSGRLGPIVRPRFDALINHPCIGSLWMSNVRLRDGFVEGDVWDSGESGSPYLPDDYRGEYLLMNFPVSCVRKVQRVA